MRTFAAQPQRKCKVLWHFADHLAGGDEATEALLSYGNNAQIDKVAPNSFNGSEKHSPDAQKHNRIAVSAGLDVRMVCAAHRYSDVT